MFCLLSIFFYTIISCNGQEQSASQDNTSSTSYQAIRPDVCFGAKWSCVGMCGQFRRMPCSCDDRCQVYNTCCEDFLHVCPTPIQTNLSKFYKAQTLCLWNNRLLIAQCPSSDWSDVRACMYHQTSFDDLVPVTDTKLGLHFRNAACARCNGFVDTVRWQVNLTCYDGVPQTLEEAFEMVTAKHCEVYFQPPLVEGLPLTSPPVHCLSTEASRCTVQTFSSNCSAFASYVRIKGTNRLFYNRFCLLCQGLESVDCDFPDIDATSPFVLAKFSSLMNWVEADGTWALTNVVDDTAVRFSCTEGSRTASSVCKVKSCPEDSVPLLNETYCVPTKDFRVVLVLAMTGKIDDSVYKSLIVPFTLGGCYFRMYSYNSSSLRYNLRCNLGTPQTHATKHNLKEIYDGLVDNLRRNDVPNTIINMTYVLLSIHDQRIYGTEVTYIPTDDNMWLEEIEWILSMICTSLSITCLSVRVLLQPFSYLLHTHPGTMQLCLCVCLLLAYSLFLVAQKAAAYSQFCWAISLLLHWAFLSSLVWMNAITYDLWSRFRNGRILSSLGESRSLKKVSIYCCLSPSLVVGTACIFDRFYPSSMFSPMYGYGLCWINQSYALIVFFVVPASFLCGMNLVLILLTFRDLHVHYKSSKVINNLSKSSPVLSVSICFKMTCLTGATWLIGLIAGFVNNPFLWMAFTVINSSCGLLVGVTLMCNRRLWGSLALPWKKRVYIRTSVTPSTRQRRQHVYSVYSDKRSNCSSSVTQSTEHI